MKYVVLLSLLIFSLSYASQPLDATTVKINFFEALSPKDTTSSERFQKEYEGAIKTATVLTAEKLLKCGYKLEEKTIFYNATDSLEALEQAKASTDAWMFIGPRRSNHYVLLVKGAPQIPSVSTMASSQEVDTLGKTHLSIAVPNSKMALVAAKEAKARTKKTSNYFSIISEDCVTCLDFAEHFDKEAARLKIKKSGEIRVNGETPDLTEATKQIAFLKPAFILLPNYSKVTAQAIASVHKVLPDAFFVGGDGWGDSRFGFVQNAKDLEGAQGFTVRGFPKTEVGLAQFQLGKKLAQSKDSTLQMPGSAAALSILKIIESTADLLCEKKPKSKLEFVRAFEKAGTKTFKSPWGVSIYDLKNGDIAYSKSVGAKK